MENVFREITLVDLYKRCIMASVSHAIMVGEYSLLSSEQYWHEKNYIFQSMEGEKGVISFGDGYFLCVIQNQREMSKCDDYHFSELFRGAPENIVELAKNDTLQYLLDDGDGNIYPYVSAAFWGDETINQSNQEERIIIRSAEDLIAPLLYNEEAAKDHWLNYYDMSDEQVEMMYSLYERRIKYKGLIYLSSVDKEKLLKWFDDIGECIESFREIDIVVE